MSNDLDSTVSVIDTMKNQVIATLSQHPEGATSLGVDPSLHRGYVAGGDLWAFDTATNQATGTIANGNTSGILALAVDASAHRAFGLTTAIRTSVLFFDLPAGSLARTVAVPTGAGFYFERVAVDPSTGRVYVGDFGGVDTERSIWALDGASGAALGQVIVPASRGGIAIDAAGRRGYVPRTGLFADSEDSSLTWISAIDLDTLAVVGKFSTNEHNSYPPSGAAAFDDGTSRLFIVNLRPGSSDSNLTAFEMPAGTEIGTVPLASQDCELVVDSSAHRAYVAQTGANSVLVVDTMSLAVVATIPVGDAPKGIAVAPQAAGPSTTAATTVGSTSTGATTTGSTGTGATTTGATTTATGATTTTGTGCAGGTPFACGPMTCSAPTQYCYVYNKVSPPAYSCMSDQLDCGCTVTCSCVPQMINCPGTTCSEPGGAVTVVCN